jgi:hypothetical protein
MSNQINARVYYSTTDGSIIFITSEMEGDVIQLSIEEEVEQVAELKNLEPSEFDVIELEYGQLFEIYSGGNKINSVNTSTRVLNLIPSISLDELKKRKLQELKRFRDRDIYSSFKSTALGVERTYNYDREAYDNFGRKATLISLDQTIDTVVWSTIEDGFITHTRQQFIQVVRDGSDHETNVKMKYWILENQVNNATSQEELDLITWE